MEQPAPSAPAQTSTKSGTDEDGIAGVVGELGENIESGEDLGPEGEVTWEEETEKGLRDKLKSLSLLPHSVEVRGKDVSLTPAVMDPGIYDGPANFKIDANLQECLDAALAKNRRKLAYIKVALVDLTNGLSKPVFAGSHHTDQVFIASVAKLAAMLAAYQLRHDLNAAAKKHSGAKTLTDLYDQVRDDWAATQNDPGGTATPFSGDIALRDKIVLWKGKTIALSGPTSPGLERIFPTSSSGVPASFRFGSTGEDKVELKKLIDNEDSRRLKSMGILERLRVMIGGMEPASNDTTVTIVGEVGYPYIASALLQSGLYDPNHGGGLWLGRDYGGGRWQSPPAGGPQQSATAGSLAALMTLVVQERLVDPSSSREMQALLLKEPNPTHPGFHSVFQEGIQKLRERGSLVRVLSKAGAADGGFDDCALIERTVDLGSGNKKTLCYVAVGLRAKSEDDLRLLIRELDKCILKNNGLTTIQGGHLREEVEAWDGDEREAVNDNHAAEIDSPDSAPEDVGVIGYDDRVRITPTTDTPWRWMCHVALEDSRGRSDGHGSGVLISDRHVLTAAHVIWDADQDPQLHFIQVRPGRDYDSEPFDSWSATRVRVCSRYKPSDADNQEWDYGLITLDKAIGMKTFKAIKKKELRFWGASEFRGSFTMGPGEPRALVNTDALTAGYRGSKAYGTELWYGKGKFRSISTKRWPNSMFTTADTTEGQSGSPLWVKDGDVLTMVGVVVAAGTTVNIVRRVSPGMIAELRKWIAEDKETPWMESDEAWTDSGDSSELEESFQERTESWTAPEDEVACDHIDASHLYWSGASTQQLGLMRRVYLRQVTAACQSRAFIGDVPDSELADIESGVRARQPAADGCRALLAAARSALSADASAANVSSIGVLSGYRSASHQLANWNRSFPRYYTETQADRAAAEGGEFGDAAAALLTRYISRRLAAPGFSLHNDGRAIDFVTVQSGKSMGADTSARNRANWRASWLFNWLVANGNSYGFFQNTSIDEPWHWEYRGTAAAATQSIETIGSLLATDTVEPPEGMTPAELTIAVGRLELRNTPLLAAHRGSQPDLILRWNDMTDPASVDVVFHFHGYSSDRDRMSLLRKEAYSGLDFSNPDDQTDTRPGRTVPTLCVLPRGSYTGDAPGGNPERYTFPAIVTPTRVRDLIAHSLGQFQSTTGASSSLSTRRLILTAHSGGGAALMRLLGNNTNDEIQIDEIQIFDALYGPALPELIRPLVSWVNRRIAAEIQAWTAGKTRADSGICVLYGGTERQSQLVQQAIQTAIAAAPADARPFLRAAYRVHRTGSWQI